ncbi:MAG TPA: phosphoribosyltransferase family protein [Candidatus Dormibacteraeota bacterium]
MREPSAAGTRLMDAPTLARTITRLAHEVRERHPDLDGVLVVAVRDGGVPPARLLVTALAEAGGTAPPLFALDVAGHRDDRPRPARPRPGALVALAAAPGAVTPADAVTVDGAIVILVDDVLHTGRTLRAALDCLADHGRPAAVEPLVLFDRGQRELPLRATYVGKNVPVAADRWVEVVARDTPSVAAGAWLVQRG